MILKLSELHVVVRKREWKDYLWLWILSVHTKNSFLTA